MVQLDDLGDVVQADAEALYVVHVACGDTVKFLEDMFLVGFGDADAVVGDAQHGVAGLGVGAEEDAWRAF